MYLRIVMILLKNKLVNYKNHCDVYPKKIAHEVIVFLIRITTICLWNFSKRKLDLTQTESFVKEVWQSIAQAVALNECGEK